MGHKLDHFYRLLQEIVAAALKASGFPVRQCTHGNNRDPVCLWPSSQLRNKRHSVHVRQFHLKQDHGGTALNDFPEAALTGNGNNRVHACEQELLYQQLGIVRLVLNDEDSFPTFISHFADSYGQLFRATNVPHVGSKSKWIKICLRKPILAYNPLLKEYKKVRESPRTI